MYYYENCQVALRDVKTYTACFIYVFIGVRSFVVTEVFLNINTSVWCSEPQKDIRRIQQSEGMVYDWHTKYQKSDINFLTQDNILL